MSETQEFNPFDTSGYSTTPNEAMEVEVKQDDVQEVKSEPEQTQEVEKSVEVSSEPVHQATESTLDTETEISQEQPTFEWPNELSQRIYDNLVEGNISDLADLMYEQKVLSSLNEMSDEDIIKLNMAYKYPELTPQEIEDEFNSKFGFEDDVDTSLMSDEELAAHKKKIDRASKAIARELKKNVGEARDYLSSMKQEISFPDILSQVQSVQAEKLNPDDIVNEFLARQDEEINSQFAEARKQYVSAIEDGLKQLEGFSVNYKDEDVQFDGKFNLTQEDKVGLSNTLKDFDLEEFYGARYFKDGKYDTKQLAEDIYFLQNRDKVVNSLVTQAVSKAKSDLLKSMKNIDYNDTPRIGATSTSNDDYDAMVSKLFSL